MVGISIGYRVHNPYVIAIIATIGGLMFGFDVSSVSAFVSEENYRAFFKYPSALEQSGITSSMPGGSFLGSIFSCKISDRFGRKFVIQLSSFIWMIGAAVQASSQNVAQLICGRVIGGFAIGLASSQIPVYLSELSPKNVRGQLVGCFQWAETWGMLIMFYISYGCSKMQGNGWRLAWGLQIVPGLLLFAGTLVLDESPRWLASKDEWDKAIQIIEATQKDSAAVRLEIEEMKESVRLMHQSEFRVLDLVNTKTSARRTLCGVMTMVWKQMDGMNVLMYYIVDVFIMAGYSHSTSTTVIASSIQYVLLMVTTVPGLYLIDKLGRRALLGGGAILKAIILWIIFILFAVYSVGTGPNGYVPPSDPTAAPIDAVRFVIPDDKPAVARAIIALTFLYACVWAPTWGVGSWVYSAEIFPTEQRATAGAVCVGSNWLFNWATGLYTLPAFKNIKWRTYAIYGSACTASIFHVLLMFPETSGKTLEEVDMMWNANIPAWRTPGWKPNLPPAEAFRELNDQKDEAVSHEDDASTAS